MPVPLKCVDVAVDASPFKMRVDDNGCHLLKMWMSQWIKSLYKMCGCHSGCQSL